MKNIEDYKVMQRRGGHYVACDKDKFYKWKMTDGQ
jgi:hypothetical protein